MKIITALNQPVGMGICFAPARKQWILSAIGAVGSIASSIFGGSKAAKAANAAERRQNKQEAGEEAWYNKKYNEDYVDTAAGQNLVRRAKDHARETWRKAAGSQAVAGGTASAAQMAKDAGNKMVGDTIADIAAADTQRKDNVDNMHRQAQEKFAQMDMNREMQRAQNITNAAQSASNAMMSVAGAIDQASSAAKPSLAGGSNNSTLSIAASQGGIDAARSNIGNVADDLRMQMGVG